MQIEKYSDRLKTLIQSAQTLALRAGHQQLTPLHVLKALLDDEERLAANLIEAAGGSATQVWRSCPKSRAPVPGKSISRRRPPACSTRPSSYRRRPGIRS
jgi:ATP-dependent Clp protease ATP-binding subunit ClpB